MQPHEALFLSFIVTNCSGVRSFSRFKRIKEFRTCIRYIKSDKLTHTNRNVFLDNFDMKKVGQNLFNCLLCYVQPYLIR